MVSDNNFQSIDEKFNNCEDRASHIIFLGSPEKKLLLFSKMQPSFGIRVDWTAKIYDIQFDEKTSQSDQVNCMKTNIKSQTYSSQALVEKYIKAFHSKWQKLYPNDKYSIFSNFSESALDKNVKRNNQKKSQKRDQKRPLKWIELSTKLMQTFSPEIFGFDFISHGHADHSSLTRFLPETIIFNPENSNDEKIRFYPLPILSTMQNLQILENRFGCKLISFIEWYKKREKDFFKKGKKGKNEKDNFFSNNFTLKEKQQITDYFNKLRKEYTIFFKEAMNKFKQIHHDELARNSIEKDDSESITENNSEFQDENQKELQKESQNELQKERQNELQKERQKEHDKDNLFRYPNGDNRWLFIPDKMEKWLEKENYFYPIMIEDYVIWLIPTGHVIGSAGLCIRRKDKIIQDLEMIKKTEIKDGFFQINCDFSYLCEFVPYFRGHCFIPPPITTKHMIIDALYGDPFLISNYFDSELIRLKIWLKSILMENKNKESEKIVFFCRELGKPQLLIQAIWDVVQSMHQNYLLNGKRSADSMQLSIDSSENDIIVNNKSMIKEQMNDYLIKDDITKDDDIAKGDNLTKDKDVANSDNLTKDNDVANGDNLTKDDDIAKSNDIAKNDDTTNGDNVTMDNDITNETPTNENLMNNKKIKKNRMKEEHELFVWKDYTLPLIMPSSFFNLFKVIFPSDIFQSLQKLELIYSKTSANKEKVKEKGPFVMLELPNQRYLRTFHSFQQTYMPKIAEISGWCAQLKYRDDHPSDKFFEISDHANIVEMIQWIKQNKIKKVWITNTISNLPLKYLREHDIECGLLSSTILKL